MSTNFSFNGTDYSIFHGIPYSFFPDDPRQPPTPITNLRDDPIQFWIHFGLVILCFMMAIINFTVQSFVRIPYGKFNRGENSVTIPQRFSFGISQFIPGIVIFSITYFLQRNFDQPVNIVMYGLFTLHYINRSIIDTIVRRHSQAKVAVWVPILAAIIIMFYHYINAQFIGAAKYYNGYYFDPRFIIGLILFLIGFVLNRVSDAQLVCLRDNYKDNKYQIPRGCLFIAVSVPNYVGEAIEWFGWAVMTWSLSGLVWFLFSISTFIPRARHIHIWYKKEFENYPKYRKALIPFLY
jgi:3-oxo-5-alpha-steroid 4-dehydrogenase 1